ncbi:SLBB domain-containing protein [uncultured Treponema sp.]|uniref:polysaccharide biosynthesis/export family protein n=1 Tax=uncultured Treponema sp. TaxID=162155 RepID=UPI0025F52EAD|nr:SLBB domain-containing protein [uncultured Treponema sp.]
MKKNYLFTSVFVFFCSSLVLNAQSLGGTSQNVVADMEKSSGAVASDVTKLPDAQLAMSVSYYPVTAGDVYTLAFAAAGSPVRYTIPVDSTYKIRVANLGVINCSGLTYLQLKAQVEALVLRNYPMAGVQFVLSSPSTFLVSISGEVYTTIERNAWALTRLSTFVNNNLTPYASVRNITVESMNGTTKTYDLFLAGRDGDLSQDPFLRPGDKIIVKRYERRVSIGGAVERPGTYDLLSGENLKDVVERYSNGLTEYADTERIILRRQNNSKNPSGDTVYIESDSIAKNFVLENADSITIPSRIELRDTMFFEGAVGALGKQSQDNTSTDKNDGGNIANPIINRIPVNFMEGENLATLIRRNAGNFFPTSDLRNAYLIRSNERLTVNVEECLYKRDYMTEFVVQKGDTLYVPYMQNISTVFVTGEVKNTVEASAWPLKRLSSFLAEHMTSYSSERNIEVTSVDGTKNVYDLFLARRYGKMENDPYVRPGETITVSRLSRKVTINGAVERPGTYELLDGENLKELVEIYGGGLAPLADASRIELYRSLTGKEGAGEKSYLNKTSILDNYQLLCYDSVTISSFSDLMPVVFVEGAISGSGSGSGELKSSTRVTMNFNIGEDYAYFARRNRGMFSAESDLANAYIIRESKTIPLNLNPMLYDASYYANVEIMPNDTLMIPFRQYFVSVAGAVLNPGRYPYIPDRTWDYYIGLAGGFDRTKNSLDAIEIRDINRKKISKSAVITPECTITAKTNSTLYYFNQYAPAITTILSIAASTISIWAVTHN